MRLAKIVEALGLPSVSDDKEIVGINTLEKAASDQLSFFNNAKHLAQLQSTKAAAVFVQEKFAGELPRGTKALICEDPYLQLAYATAFFAHEITAQTGRPDIGSKTEIADNVQFGNNVTVGEGVRILPGCYIGDNVTIGDHTLLHPNVTVYHNCEVGSNVILHSGVVVGSDGYGFASKPDGTHVKIYQNGNAVIEDDVELGANTVVDRAVFNSTVVKQGSKLDNLIHIAHNCVVGENNFFAAQVGLSGSTETGRNVMMGGQGGTAGHLRIADHTVIAARGGVTKDVKKAGYYAGFPLMDGKLWLKLQAKLARLLKS